jgi:hypothetical protein
VDVNETFIRQISYICMNLIELAASEEVKVPVMHESGNE